MVGGGGGGGGGGERPSLAGEGREVPPGQSGLVGEGKGEESVELGLEGGGGGQGAGPDTASNTYVHEDQL